MHWTWTSMQMLALSRLITSSHLQWIQAPQPQSWPPTSRSVQLLWKMAPRDTARKPMSGTTRLSANGWLAEGPLSQPRTSYATLIPTILSSSQRASDYAHLTSCLCLRCELHFLPWEGQDTNLQQLQIRGWSNRKYQHGTLYSSVTNDVSLSCKFNSRNEIMSRTWWFSYRKLRFFVMGWWEPWTVVHPFPWTVAENWGS